MTRDDLEQYVHGLYQAWNRGDMERFYAGVDLDVTDHNAGEDESGQSGVRTALDTIRAAFPDHAYVVERVVVDEPRSTVAVHLTASGTHDGADFFGIPASGRHATWSEMRFARIRDHRTVEHWATVDSLSMMVQLGHVVPPTTRETW